MRDYAFYSGLGTQLIITILIFAGAGYYLDKKFPSVKPLFIVVFSLLGIGVGLYTVIRQILKKQK